MSLIGLVLVLVLLGVGLYLLGMIPMDATIKKIIQVVVIVVVILWVVEALGLLSMGPTISLRH